MQGRPEVQAPWRGRLRLRLAHVHGRTVIAARSMAGPLAVQKALYPEGDVAHVYVLHPPGGLVGGDELAITLELDAGSAALVTTPAAGKVYRSAGLTARQTAIFEVATGAGLEWLPQDTILFDGSDYAATTQVRLALGARFIGRELLALGRPAHGDDYAHGELEQRFTLYRERRLLLGERTRWTAPSPFMAAPWGLAGHGVLGVLYACPADAAACAAVRAQRAPGLRAAATLIEDLLCLRVLGHDAGAARSYLDAVWHALRARVIGRTPCVPRVWHT